MFKPSSIFLQTVQRRGFFCGSSLLFMFHVCLCYAVLFVPCNLVVTCWGKDLCVMFSCVFVTFPYGVPGQVWYLTVSIPDIYLLPHFKLNEAIELSLKV